MHGKRVAAWIVALVVGVSATAVAGAAIPDSGTGTITGCYSNGSGGLRVIDAQAGEGCRGGETPLTWNQAGPQGPQGPQGPAGPAGPVGPQGERGPSDVYSTGNHAISNPWAMTSTPRHLMALSLGVGDYLLSVHLTFNLAQGRTEPGQASCVLSVDGPNGGPLNFGSVQVDPVEGGGGSQTLHISTITYFEIPRTLHLECSGRPDNAVSVSTAGGIHALQVGRVHAPGRP